VGRNSIKILFFNLLPCFRIVVLLLVTWPVVSGAATVATTVGKVSGVVNGDIHSFKGIPYAKPPVGELRWNAPQTPEENSKIIDAKVYGDTCLQVVRPGRKAPIMSEDCLSLNVWTPAPDSEKRPVMVWIHGGAFRSGSGIVSGETFAKQGAVLVSINYRLGPLGFFAHEVLADKPANLALLDMIAALEWVQTNIQSFGGDPNNVTIFGVSAGGMAVELLMTNDKAKGLFHRAIGQSGYAAWALPRTVDAPVPAPKDVYLKKSQSAEAISHNLVARISNKPQTKDMLYQLNGLELINAQLGFQVPIVDGNSVQEEPGIRFMRSQQHDVPFISGGNSFEGSVMRWTGISADNYTRSIGDAVEEARKLYRDDADDIWLQRMFGDNRYLLSARLLVENTKNRPSPAWLYYIDFVAGEKKHGLPGTAHGSDAYFAFRGHLDKNQNVRALSQRMQKYWVNFSRNGDPNGAGLLQWPAYEEQSNQWLVFSESDTVQVGVIQAKLDFLESFFYKRISGLD